MKRIPLKTASHNGVEMTYAFLIEACLAFPGEHGQSLSEIRLGLRVLDALEGAEDGADGFDLEDAEAGFLHQRVEAMRWNTNTVPLRTAAEFGSDISAACSGG